MRRFIADASHELRTPLTSIRGFAELHRQGKSLGQTPPIDLMARIEGEAKRMGVLVDDLLLLARLDQQRPLERNEVRLADMISDVAADAPVVAPAHNVAVDISPDAHGVVVSGEEPRIRQVVRNLVSNAYTHTPAGTNISISLQVDAETARIEVADDGPGMPSDDAARVFERFYRSDLSRTRARGGSGLGLSIAEGIVRAHGGTIAVATAPGEGSRFTVILPLALAAQEEESRQSDNPIDH